MYFKNDDLFLFTLPHSLVARLPDKILTHRAIFIPRRLPYEITDICLEAAQQK